MFKQPIRVDNITQEQYNEITPLLKQLGYTGKDPSYLRKDAKSLVTCLNGMNDFFGLLQNPNHNKVRLSLPYNKDLILAIAAMREGNDLHVGEYLIWKSSSELVLYKITEVCDKTHVNIEWNNEGKINTIKRQVVIEEFARKATVEEIIAYFNSSSPSVDKYDMWCVEVPPGSNEAKIVANYINEAINRDYLVGNSRYYAFKKGGNILDTCVNDKYSDALDKYTMISFDEFQRHILKKEVIVNNQIHSNDNQKQDGSTVKVPRSAPSITTGQRFTGNPIRGRASKATVRLGHLSNQEITG